MSNRTYVCFDCRTTERVPVARITKKCRKCRKPAEHVYHKFRIPGRVDDRGWAELQGKVRRLNREVRSRALAQLEKEQEKLERRLSAIPENRLQVRRDLGRRLRLIKGQAAEWAQW